MAPFAGSLSHGQRALWFLHRLAPAASVYNIAAAARVLSPRGRGGAGARGAGAGRPPRRSADDLPDRGPRRRRDGEPRQRVAGRLTFELGREDAAGWSAERLRCGLAEEASEEVGSRAGAAAAGGPVDGGRRVAGGPAGDPPHRGGFLVAGGADAGARGALPGGLRRRAGGPGAAGARFRRSTSDRSGKRCAARGARSCSPTGGSGSRGCRCWSWRPTGRVPRSRPIAARRTGCGCRRSWCRSCGG